MQTSILHIFPSNLENQSRLFKEARFVLNAGLAKNVYVLSLWSKNQVEHEVTECGLIIIRVKTLVRRKLASSSSTRRNLFRKCLSFISFLEFFFKAANFVRRKKIDYISCHYVSTLPFCYLLSLLSNSKLIYMPHELETERFGVRGIRKFIDKIFEYIFVRAAREIVVVCDPIAKWYRSSYGLKNVHVVRNVPEESATSIKLPPEGNFRDRFLIPKTATIFIYQGLLGRGRGTEELLKIFSELSPDYYHLILMGYGDSSIQSAVERAVIDYKNIHYQAAVPIDKIISYTAGADVGIIITERASLSYQYSLPNKFFEYLHAGLPVLVSNNLNYLSSLVGSHKIGWAIPIDNLKQELISIAQTGLNNYQENVRVYSSTAIWESDAKNFFRIYKPKITL